jgi:hypothetical protein
MVRRICVLIAVLMLALLRDKDSRVVRSTEKGALVP